MDFTLDPLLDADTLFVADLPLCQVRLMTAKAICPWLVLVPRRQDLVEMVDLADADQQQLMTEIGLVSRVLQQEFTPYKLNIAAIGNVVRQLHVHVVARRQDDPAWPALVWAHDAPPYLDDEAQALRARLQTLLQL